MGWPNGKADSRDFGTALECSKMTISYHFSILRV